MQIIITNLSRLKPDAAECSYDSDLGENDRSEEETAYLKAHGYPTGGQPSLQEIISVMQLAVTHCREPLEGLFLSGSEPVTAI